jgi:hypothetical protein
MVQLKIKLKNELNVRVKVKEGNAGIFRNIITLEPKKVYEISHDPNATYREYTLIMLPNRTQLRMLSSDDFNDWKKIKIYQDDGICDWMGTEARDPARRRTMPAAPPASVAPLVAPPASVAPPVAPPASVAPPVAVGANGSSVVGTNGGDAGAGGVNGVASGAQVAPLAIQTSNGRRWRKWF